MRTVDRLRLFESELQVGDVITVSGLSGTYVIDGVDKAKRTYVVRRDRGRREQTKSSTISWDAVDKVLSKRSVAVDKIAAVRKQGLDMAIELAAASIQGVAGDNADLLDAVGDMRKAAEMYRKALARCVSISV